MISSFMVLKNALKTGYPFVEAITACLPVSDELLISDGYSTDGTYEVLQKISKLNNKVKISRQEWPTAKSYSVIGTVTNAIRARCSYDYILSIQANEIIHEDTAPFIKALPEICPDVHTFSLPFVHLVKDYKFYEDFRLRLSKNFAGIIAVGDAWALGTSKSFVRAEALKSLRNPRRLASYIGKGIGWTYANNCVNPKSRAMYLSKPIFRYWSLFPKDYLEKCEKHAEMFGLNELRKDVETLKNYVHDTSVFWRKAAEIRRSELGFHYPDALGSVELKGHPKVMHGLLVDSAVDHYYVRNDVLDSISGL